MRNNVVVFVLLAGILPSAIPSSSAQVMGRKIPCQAIASIPSTVSKPGRYCLASNFSTDAWTGVEITSSDVVLDCGGFEIVSTAQSPSTSGIEIYPGRDSVTVQNCKLVGFKVGISAGPAKNNQLINNQIQGSAYTGIRASGYGTRVVGNRIIGTQNTIADSVGIELSSSSVALPMAGVVLINNVIAGIKSDQNVYGIRISAASAPQITNNQVLDLESAPGYSARAIVLASDGNIRTTGASLINNAMMSRGTTPVTGFATDGSPDATCIGNIAVALSDSGFTNTCQKASDNSELP